MSAWRWVLALLVVVSAGYMVVDGLRALIVGDYFTIDGQLGPWAPIVSALGIEPRSLAMKTFFVLFGALWLVALGLYLARRATWRILLAFAVASLWYLVIGTAVALAQIALLLLVVRTRER